jgi:hypothetical protein
MSDQSTFPAPRRKPRYPSGKRKRFLYLTDQAFAHLVDLANSNGVFPSEVCEQIIRNHVNAVAIPSANKVPTSFFVSNGTPLS